MVRNIYIQGRHYTLFRGSNEPFDFKIFFNIYNIFFVSLILRFFLKNIIFAHPDLNFIHPYYKYFQL